MPLRFRPKQNVDSAENVERLRMVMEKCVRSSDYEELKEIAGLIEAKESFMINVLMPIKSPTLFVGKMKIDKAILLYGVSGKIGQLKEMIHHLHSGHWDWQIAFDSSSRCEGGKFKIDAYFNLRSNFLLQGRN